MFRKSLIVFVISIFLFSAFALTEAYAFRNQGPSGAGPESSAAGIEVYDADGQYLGLSSFSQSISIYSVYVPSLSRYVGIDLSTGEGGAMTLLFQSNDCTGTPYVFADQTYWIGKIGGKYYTGARTVPVEMETYSWVQGIGECRDLQFKLHLVPAEEVSADSLPFTFPLALPLEFK